MDKCLPSLKGRELVKQGESPGHEGAKFERSAAHVSQGCAGVPTHPTPTGSYVSTPSYLVWYSQLATLDTRSRCSQWSELKSQISSRAR